MRRHRSRGSQSNSAYSLSRLNRKPKLESLEPRLVLTSLTLEQAFGELSGHSGVCSCPVCTGQGLEVLATESFTASASVAAAPLSSLPQLHSNAGASAKLFLDFNGRFESSWGSWSNVNTPVFDQDGDRSSFSDGELAAIQQIWARVAEDYAPFNIDVTTVDPGNQANHATAVIAIGGSHSDWYGSSAGGVAFVGGFSNSSSNVGYVFEDALGSNARYVAEAASHEAGHLFGLRHQSVWNGNTLVETYNSGNSSWAPIMGNSYSAARSTWHNGTTNISSTSFQDDIAVIGGAANAFGFKGDDFGSTIALASNLAVSDNNVNFAGLIGQNNDMDVWKFTTTGGQASFSLNVAQFGANLDSILEIRNAANNVLFSSDPTTAFGASLTAVLGTGTFYLVARGTGGYGNIGQYTITGTLPAQGTAPEITVLVGGSSINDGSTVSFGSTPLGTAVSKTITVKNDGSATLHLTALNASLLPAGYTLTSNLGNLTLAPGASTTFAVRLDATEGGIFGGEILLVSDDADENPFNISLSGSVTTAPEITFSENGGNLTDGGSLSFGVTSVGQSVVKTFTVKNDGNAVLTLVQINQSNMPAGFTLASALGSTSLNPGESTTFLVRMDAVSAGNPSGTISLSNNDDDEDPFDLTISGTVESVDLDPSYAFDFGTATSALEAGYTRVTSSSTYSTSAGFGWSGGSIYSRDRTSGTSLTRDFNFTRDGSFVVDLANGTYDVTVLMGDASAGHDQMGLYFEGTLVDSISAAPRQFITRTYQVSVTDDQLTLRLRDLGGVDVNVVLNALTIAGTGQPAQPPTVQSLSASPGVVRVGDAMTLTASGVDDEDGDVAEVLFYRDSNGNGTPETGTDQLLGRDQDGSNGWALQFSTAGLAVGTHTFFAIAEDAGGLSSDPVSATATVQEVPPTVTQQFDFGTASSLLEAGYTRVTSSSTYSSSAGFGWTSGTIDSRNRSSGTALTRDFNFTRDGSFVVDVANGTYDVTVVMGDASSGHDQMGLYLEGSLADSITATANQFVTRTYQVSVADGQLTLRLRDLGGGDVNVVLNALTITGTGQPAQPPTVQSLSASPSVVTVGDAVTLTASGVDDEDGDVAEVRFYRDANGNGTLETGTDQLLGRDQDRSNGWALQFSTAGLSVGTHTFFAVAEDAGGLSSDPVSAIATVEEVPPTVTQQFDFGTASSAVEAGYTRVTSSSTYSSGAGFGWSSGTITSRDRSSGTALTRDFNFTRDGSFVVDLANGTYDVTVVMGDASSGHDQMGLYFEGALADSITAAANQFITRTYQVSVTDGQLTLRLRDLGGGDVNVVLNALTIETASGSAVVDSADTRLWPDILASTEEGHISKPLWHDYASDRSFAHSDRQDANPRQEFNPVAIDALLSDWATLSSNLPKASSSLHEVAHEKLSSEVTDFAASLDSLLESWESDL